MNKYYMLRSFDHAGYYETRSVLMIVAIVVAIVFWWKRGDRRYLVMLVSGIFFQAALEYYLQFNNLRGADYSLSAFGLRLSGIPASLFQGCAEGGILSLMAFWFADLRMGGWRASRKYYLAICGLIILLASMVGIAAGGLAITSPRPMFTVTGFERLAAFIVTALLLVTWKRAWRELWLFYVGLLIYVLITFEPLQIFGARYIGERSPDGKFFPAPYPAQVLVMMASHLIEVAGGKIHYFAVPLALGLISFRRETEPAGSKRASA